MNTIFLNFFDFTSFLADFADIQGLGLIFYNLDITMGDFIITSLVNCCVVSIIIGTILYMSDGLRRGIKIGLTGGAVGALTKYGTQQVQNQNPPRRVIPGLPLPDPSQGGQSS